MNWGISIGLSCDEFPDECVYTPLKTVKEKKGHYNWPILFSFALDGFSTSTGRLKFAVRLARLDAPHEGRLHVDEIEMQASKLTYVACSPRSFNVEYETQRLTRKNSVYGDAPQLSYDSKFFKCEDNEQGINLSFTYKAAQYRDEQYAVMVGYIIIDTVELQIPVSIIDRLVKNRGHKVTCMLKSLGAELFISRPQKIETVESSRIFEWSTGTGEIDNFGMTPRTASKVDYDRMVIEMSDTTIIKRLDKRNKHGSVLMTNKFVPDNDAYTNPCRKLPFFIRGRLIVEFHNFYLAPPFGPLRLKHEIPMREFLQLAENGSDYRARVKEGFELTVKFRRKDDTVEICGVRLCVEDFENKLKEF